MEHDRHVVDVTIEVMETPRYQNAGDYTHKPTAIRGQQIAMWRDQWINDHAIAGPGTDPSVPQQAVAGIWRGRLTWPRGQLSVTLNIQGTDDKLSGTLDDPDQNLSDVELDSVSFDSSDGGISFKVPSLSASFEGKLTGRRIRGTWSQKGGEGTLTLSR